MPAWRVLALLRSTRGGLLMTVKLEPPRLKRIGSLHALTLTREERPNAVVGDIPALPVNPISATS
jgi:hypothetical protein